MVNKCEKNAIWEPTWSQLGLPKQKKTFTRRNPTGYATPSQRSFAPPKGMGRPEPNHLTHVGHETPAHCDASRISAGVHFRESAPAGRNHAKHFQNLPTVCSKGPKSSQISPQTFPKPSQNLPKASQNPSRSPLGAHFGPMLERSSILNVQKAATWRPKAPKGGPRRPQTPPK